MSMVSLLREFASNSYNMYWSSMEDDRERVQSLLMYRKMSSSHLKVQLNERDCGKESTVGHLSLFSIGQVSILSWMQAFTATYHVLNTQMLATLWRGLPYDNTGDCLQIYKDTIPGRSNLPRDTKSPLKPLENTVTIDSPLSVYYSH
jgi:hypothetical protein